MQQQLISIFKRVRHTTKVLNKLAQLIKNYVLCCFVQFFLFLSFFFFLVSLENFSFEFTKTSFKSWSDGFKSCWFWVFNFLIRNFLINFLRLASFPATLHLFQLGGQYFINTIFPKCWNLPYFVVGEIVRQILLLASFIFKVQQLRTFQNNWKQPIFNIVLV